MAQPAGLIRIADPDPASRRYYYPTTRPRRAPLPCRSTIGVSCVGSERIARLVLGLREKFWAANRTIEIATVNGETGLCIRDGDHLTAVMSIETDGERILAVYAVVNPDKLGVA